MQFEPRRRLNLLDVRIETHSSLNNQERFDRRVSKSIRLHSRGYFFPTECCVVNIDIQTNTNNTNTTNYPTETATTMMTVTPQQGRPNPTTDSPTATSTTTTHSYFNFTAFHNVSSESGSFTCRQAAVTISATVCVIAALLIGVGVFVILTLKRKRFLVRECPTNSCSGFENRITEKTAISSK